MAQTPGSRGRSGTAASVRRKLAAGDHHIDNFSTSEQRLARDVYDIKWTKSGAIDRRALATYESRLTPAGTFKAPPVTDAASVPAKEATWLKPATPNNLTPAQQLAKQQALSGAHPDRITAASEKFVAKPANLANRMDINPQSMSPSQLLAATSAPDPAAIGGLSEGGPLGGGLAGPTVPGSMDMVRARRNASIMSGALEYPEGPGGRELARNIGMTPPVHLAEEVPATFGPSRSLTPRSTALEPYTPPGGLARIGAGTNGAAPGPGLSEPIATPFPHPNVSATEPIAQPGIGERPLSWNNRSFPSVPAETPVGLPGTRPTLGPTEPAFGPLPHEALAGQLHGPAAPSGPTAFADLPASTLAGTEAEAGGGLLSKLGGFLKGGGARGTEGFGAARAAAVEGGAGRIGGLAAGLGGSGLALGLGVPIAGGLLAKPVGTIAQRLAGGDDTTKDEAGVGASDIGQFAEGATRWGSMAAPALMLPAFGEAIVGTAALAGGLWNAFSQGEDPQVGPEHVFDAVKKTMAKSGVQWDEADQNAAVTQYSLLVDSGTDPAAAKAQVVKSIIDMTQQQQQEEDFQKRQMAYNRDSTQLMMALQGQQLMARRASEQQFGGYVDQAQKLAQDAIGQEGLSPADAAFARMMSAQTAQSLMGIQNAYSTSAIGQPTVDMFQNSINSRNAMDSQLQQQILQRQIQGMLPANSTATPDLSALAASQQPAA